MLKRELRSVLVIYKKSDVQIYVKEHQDPYISQLLERDDASIHKMIKSHQENEEAFAHLRALLKRRKIRSRWVYRARSRNIEGFDLVLAVGGDGTLLEAARKIHDQTPLLGINSSPSSSVGYLTATDAQGIEETLEAYLAGTLHENALARIQAEIEGQPILPYALNDILFSHTIPAATSRYEMTLSSGEQEQHRSSGLWIATATGSTAAIHSAGGAIMEHHDQRLQYRVRELYKLPHPVPPRLEYGYIAQDEALTLTSRMRRAVLYFDGPWVRRPIHYNQRVRFRRAAQPLLLYGNLRK